MIETLCNDNEEFVGQRAYRFPVFYDRKTTTLGRDDFGMLFPTLPYFI
jgi:hypothetical protein